MRTRATLIALTLAATTAVSCAAPPPGAGAGQDPALTSTTQPPAVEDSTGPDPAPAPDEGALAPVAVPTPSPEELFPLRWDGPPADQVDVPYGPDPAHLGDLYLPTGGGNRGVIVVAHGGAFVEGDRGHALEWYGPLMAQTRRGFAVFNVAYRLTSGDVAVFPAGVSDLSLAVDWVRAEGAAHGLNPETIVVAGHSAGGTLATLVGLGSNSDATGPLGRTAPVDGWLSMSGIYDFAEATAPVQGLGGVWLGANAADPFWVAAASPTSHLDLDDPPGFVVHGDQDGIIPVDQAWALIAAAARLGVSTGLHYDLVATGSDDCRGHLPQCGQNAPALDSWFDGVSDRTI